MKQMSEDSYAFKTITSHSQTRNETNNKKYYLSKSKRKSRLEKSRKKYDSQDIHYMRQSLSYLEERRKKLANKKNYSQLSKTQSHIDSLKKQLKIGQIQLLEDEQKMEQKKLYDAHNIEMQKFNRVWTEIFMNFQKKEQSKIRQLKNDQNRQKQIAENKLYLKAKKIKPFDQSLRDIQKVQKIFLQNERYEDLLKLKAGKLKKSIKKEMVKQRNKELMKLQERQEEKLNKEFTKRNNSLKMKIKLDRQHCEKVYLKNQNRMKQKFMNTLNTLKHNQAMLKNKFNLSLNLE